MITRIKNGRFLLGEEICENIFLYFGDGKITEVTQEELPFDEEIDAQGQYVSPGFIDIHVHGGNGSEFTDASERAVLNCCNIHGSHGTTTIFPTISTSNYDNMYATLEVLKTFRSDERLLPQIAGVHLEGPYFSRKQTGAQAPDFFGAPDPEQYMRLIGQYGDLIRRWSYAPELDGAIAFQDCLNEHGIVGAAGHTDAEYCHMKEAYAHGCKLITHLYSCTSTIVRKCGFRHLGVIETAYLLDDMDVEAIADGCHLPPELLQLIYKIKGKEHMCLVTDATRFGGVKEGDRIMERFADLPYLIEDGVAKLKDRSAFAGSIATTDVLVRTCVKKVGIPLVSAVKMITQNPARIMGLSSRGSLQAGYDADIILFDEDIRVSTVIVGGQVKVRQE